MAVKDWKKVWFGKVLKWDKKNSDVSLIIRQDIYLDYWIALLFNSHTNKRIFESKSKNKVIDYVKSYMKKN